MKSPQVLSTTPTYWLAAEPTQRGKGPKQTRPHVVAVRESCHARVQALQDRCRAKAR